jgi:hypothetical protein
MNNRTKLLYLLGYAAVISGCAVTPSREAIGPYPNNSRAIIKAHVMRTYFDPYSIRSASVSQTIEGHLYFQQGWLVCLESNAKNRMGGYVGIQRTAYLINRGSIVQTMEKAPLCDDPQFFYSPWSELEQLK